MPLRHRLTEYVTADGGADGKPTPYRVAKDAGISTNTIYRLLGDDAAPIAWPTLEALCSTLGVQPGELIVYEPAAE